MSGERLHNMKSVERRTGLGASVIRVWERRYGAVKPQRAGNLRRLYTEEEVERLTLLGRLTQAGLAIGQIATLPLENLRAMQSDAERENRVVANAGGDAGGVAARAAVSETTPHARGAAVVVRPEELVLAGLEAIRRYDMMELDALLDRGMVGLGYSGLLERVLIPMLRAIGDAWERGELTAAHEHGATSAFKDYLARNVRTHAPSPTSPRLLVTTPAGQLHEMGAAIAASLARKSGWQVTYLGPSLPAEEIVSAVLANQFRAVALSIIYPEDDPELPAQLARLRQLLPREIPIIAGGRAVASYRGALDQIGAIILTEMSDFARVLGEIRASGVNDTLAAS